MLAGTGQQIFFCPAVLGSSAYRKESAGTESFFELSLNINQPFFGSTNFILLTLFY